MSDKEVTIKTKKIVRNKNRQICWTLEVTGDKEWAEKQIADFQFKMNNAS